MLKHNLKPPSQCRSECLSVGWGERMKGQGISVFVEKTTEYLMVEIVT